MNAANFISQSYGVVIVHHIVKLTTAFLLLSFAVSIQNVAGDSQGSKALLVDTAYFSELTNEIGYGVEALNSAVLKADRTPKHKLLAEIKVLKSQVDQAIAQYKKAHPSKLSDMAGFEEKLNQYYVHIFYFIMKVQAGASFEGVKNSTHVESMNKQLMSATKQLEAHFLAMATSLDNLKIRS